MPATRDASALLVAGTGLGAVAAARAAAAVVARARHAGAAGGGPERGAAGRSAGPAGRWPAARRTSLLVVLAGAAVLAPLVPRRRRCRRRRVAAAGVVAWRPGGGAGRRSPAGGGAAPGARDRGAGRPGGGGSPWHGRRRPAVTGRPWCRRRPARRGAVRARRRRGAVGPFVRLGSLDAAAVPHAAPRARGPPDPPLDSSTGRAAVLTADGVVAARRRRPRPGAGPRARRRPRAARRASSASRATGSPAGSARVSSWSPGLRPGDPVAIRVRDVAAAGRVGATARCGCAPTATRPAPSAGSTSPPTPAPRTWPRSTCRWSRSTPRSAPPPLDVADLRPGRRTGHCATGTRLDRITAEPGRVEVTPLAGGLDPACGLTADPQRRVPGGPGPPARARTAALWFVTGGGHARRPRPRRACCGPCPARCPGPATGLVATADGAVVLALAGPDGPALWRLPAATSALARCRRRPPDARADPPPVGPPVRLVPVANTGDDRPRRPAGRLRPSWASGTGRGAPARISSTSSPPTAGAGPAGPPAGRHARPRRSGRGGRRRGGWRSPASGRRSCTGVPGCPRSGCRRCLDVPARRG